MKDILVHTSDVLVDVLEPNFINNEESPCICFSLNSYLPFFGRFVYLFDYDTLKKHMTINRIVSGGYFSVLQTNQQANICKQYRFKSGSLGYEYRVYQPINVKDLSLGVITMFSHFQGELERIIRDKILRKQVNWESEVKHKTTAPSVFIPDFIRKDL